MPYTNNLHYLPEDTICMIKNYMWGDKQDWKYKFDKIIVQYSNRVNNIDNVISKLRVCHSQKRLNTVTNIEDCFYCSICGEKTLDFTFLFNPQSFQKCVCIV